MSSSSRKNPRDLTTLSEILSCLSAYQSEEAELSKSLTDLLNAREPIVASLDRLRLLVPRLDDSRMEAEVLCKRVSTTARTAERVGSRVRSLDEEMGRIREAGERVGQVMELKVNCVYNWVVVDNVVYLMLSNISRRCLLCKRRLKHKIGNRLRPIARKPCRSLLK